MRAAGLRVTAGAAAQLSREAKQLAHQKVKGCCLLRRLVKRVQRLQQHGDGLGGWRRRRRVREAAAERRARATEPLAVAAVELALQCERLL